MELDSNILRRCKQVIEQLQNDLAKKTAESQQKDQALQNMMNERNSMYTKNQQLQQLMYELKEANVVLRGQLKKAQDNQFVQKQNYRLQRQLQTLSQNYQNKLIQNKQLQMRLMRQTQNKRDIDQEIGQAIKDVSMRIRMLQQEIIKKDQQNQKLKQIINNRKCEYCDAISDINNLNNLRRKIDDNIRSNSKILSNQNYIRTASSKKSSSLMRDFSDKKNTISGNIVNNNMRLRSKMNDFSMNNYCAIPPFVLDQKPVHTFFQTKQVKQPKQPSKYYYNENYKQNMIPNKRSNSINQEAVNATLRQIQDKLKKMSQKLQQNQSDISTILY